MRRPSEIVEAVCEQHEVIRSQLLGRSRITEIVRARKALVKELSQEGYQICEIGRVINRKHATVIHLLRNTRSPRSNIFRQKQENCRISIYE